jgi:hypothetical protein
MMKGGRQKRERAQTWGKVGTDTKHECSKAAPNAPRELQLLGVFGYQRGSKGTNDVMPAYASP